MFFVSISIGRHRVCQAQRLCKKANLGVALHLAGLDLGLFTTSSKRMTFYESIKRNAGVTHPLLSPVI